MSEDKKILKCRFHGKEWNGYKIHTVKVSDLWASVPKAIKHRGKEFYNKVRDDIDKNGLHFPLIVVDARRGDLIKQKKKYGDKIRDLPFDKQFDDLNIIQLTVWGGSNRWFVAHELGYEYVDCIIVPDGDFNKARSMQCMHRAPYQGGRAKGLKLY